ARLGSDGRVAAHVPRPTRRPSDVTASWNACISLKLMSTPVSWWQTPTNPTRNLSVPRNPSPRQPQPQPDRHRQANSKEGRRSGSDWSNYVSGYRTTTEANHVYGRQYPPVPFLSASFDVHIVCSRRP